MELVKYNINEAEIAKMSDIYMNLAIKDLEDQEGYEAVHTARMVMVKHRTAVDKLRKSANETAQKFIKNNNANAARLTGLMEPIETHLKIEEDKVTKEKERIKAREEAKEKAKIETRVSELFALGVNVPFFDLAMLGTAEYEKVLSEATEKYQTEQGRLKKEAQARELEEKKLEETRKAQEAEAARLAKIQADINAKERALRDEQDKLEADKKAEQDNRDKAEFERKVEEDAKIQAEKDATEKMLHEKKEKEDRLVAEKIEAERKEKLRPIKDRIYDYADDILKETPPVFKEAEATKIIQWAISELTDLSARIKLKADNL